MVTSKSVGRMAVSDSELRVLRSCATDVSSSVFWAKSTTRDYIMAEGGFHIVERTPKGRDKTERTECENEELSGEKF